MCNSEISVLKQHVCFIFSAGPKFQKGLVGWCWLRFSEKITVKVLAGAGAT